MEPAVSCIIKSPSNKAPRFILFTTCLTSSEQTGVSLVFVSELFQWKDVLWRVRDEWLSRAIITVCLLLQPCSASDRGASCALDGRVHSENSQSLSLCRGDVAFNRA